MKRIIVLMVLVVLSLGAIAQAQEIEQLKINLEKLAQLKLMLARSKQGYQVLENGYNSVRDAAKGNFQLHERELNSLLVVRPAVKQIPALEQMEDNSSNVQRLFEEWMRYVLVARVFSGAELLQVRERHHEITAMMRDDAAQVQLVLTPGILRMNDAERIAAIEMLAKNTERLCTKLRGYISEQSRIAAARMQHKKDKESMLRLYGKE